MNLLGIHLNLLIGGTVPTPAPLALNEALQSIEVTHSDAGPSGFQLTFRIGRATPLDLLDFPLLSNTLLAPSNRVILLVRFAVAPQVLMDGIITNHQLSPSNEPGASTLTVTGEDVSVMMDKDEEAREFPAQPDNVVVMQLLAQYAQYGLIPTVIPPVNLNVPIPTQQTPQRPANYTDRGYIQTLAQRHGHVFYITPGPAPGSNTAYWWPPVRVGVPQSALSVNMGPHTNVESISFRYNGLSPTKVEYRQDDQNQSIETPSPTRIPLAANRAPIWHTKKLSDAGGEIAITARARAQGLVDQSFDGVVTASGTLDALRYNGLLKARGIVGLRGVGRSYDGFYYVKSVTHKIKKGEYKQSFTLTREGTGTTTPFIMP